MKNYSYIVTNRTRTGPYPCFRRGRAGSRKHDTSRIDHVALWVADREADTRRILDLFDIDVLEKTDDFTLIGSDPELGKLTLFDAEGPRAQSQLMGIAFREPGREDAQDIDVGEGLHLYRLGEPHAWAVDLDHVSLRVADAEASAKRWVDLGFEQVEPRVEPSARVKLGDSFIELTPGTRPPRHQTAPQPHRPARGVDRRGA